MRKKRLATGLLLVALLVTVLAVAAPGASAGQVTKIQYPQQSCDIYEVVAPTGARNISAELSWTDVSGNAIDGYPTSEVDLNLQGPSGSDAYADLTDSTWYSGDNPLTTSAVKATAGETYYVGVMPWIGDCKYTLTIKINGVAIDGYPVTGTVYGGGGEVFVPSNGTWHSCVQWWAGTTGSVYSCWNDYVYERVAGDTFDTMAEAYTSTMVAPQPAVTTTVNGSGTNPNSNKWYSVIPEIWPSAANPNTWPSGASVPKPGSLLWNGTGASAWYTYSFADSSVTTDKPGYFWSTTGVATASQRSFSSDASSASSLTYRFYGPSVKWVYPTYKYGGIQNVYVDDVLQGTVDQYSSSLVQKNSKTYSGFGSSSYHTIKIASSKTKNTSSSGFFLYHDAFEGLDSASDPTPRAENNLDGMTTYDIAHSSSASASGGTFASTKSATAALAYTFYGTSITWKYNTYKYGGIQRVLIDGVRQSDVDQYSSSMAFQQTTTFSGLTAGWHTILINGTGTKNTSSSGYFLYHDAFIVGSTTIED